MWRGPWQTPTPASVLPVAVTVRGKRGPPFAGLSRGSPRAAAAAVRALTRPTHSLAPLAGAAGAELNPEDLKRPAFPAGVVCYNCLARLSDVERASLSLTVSNGSTMRLYRREDCECEAVARRSISAPNFATMLSLLEDDVKAAFLAEVEAWVVGKKEIAAARGKKRTR